MELKVFLLDDDHESLKTVCSILDKHCDVDVVGVSSNTAEALELIIDLEPDMIICDVQMPGVSGIELARKIRTFNSRVEIVFLTAYETFALEAIKLEALDYILKPVDEEELFFTIDRLKKKTNAVSMSFETKALIKELKKINKLRFNNVNGFILLKPEDIMYVQADGNYSTLFLVDGRNEMACQNLLCIEKKLSDFNFIRLSRSYLLNMEYVSAIDRKKKICVLQAGSTTISIPIPSERMREISKIL